MKLKGILSKMDLIWNCDLNFLNDLIGEFWMLAMIFNAIKELLWWGFLLQISSFF